MKCSHTGLAHTCRVFRVSSCCGRAPPTVIYRATHLCHNSVVIQSAVIIYSMNIILNGGPTQVHRPLGDWADIQENTEDCGTRSNALTRSQNYWNLYLQCTRSKFVPEFPHSAVAPVRVLKKGAPSIRRKEWEDHTYILSLQLFPKLWDSSCFSHHMISIIMVGFNEQISLEGILHYVHAFLCLTKSLRSF